MDPFEQIEFLRSQSISLRPSVYRIYALYLQLLRNSLPNVVRQAILELVKTSTDEIKNLPTPDLQKSFQLKIDDIISNAISLLTIEHLVDLSKTLEKEHKDYIEQVKNQIDKESTGNDEEFKRSSGNLSSVELSLQMPIDENLRTDTWSETSLYELVPESNTIPSLKDHNYRDEDNSNDPNFNDAIDGSQNGKPQESRNSISLLKSIFSLANVKILHRSNHSIRRDQSSLNEAVSIVNEESFVNNSLPEMPEEIFSWMNSLDSALETRLRNLSHIINIELLRIGLINSYIPTSLLEGVLSGQIQSLHSPSNLLRLRLPVQDQNVEGVLDILCIFVRPSELEFDDFKLRKCRQKILDYRKKIQKMVKQQDYWNKRCLAKELENNWWKIPLKNKLNKKNKNHN